MRSYFLLIVRRRLRAVFWSWDLNNRVVEVIAILCMLLRPYFYLICRVIF